MSEEDDIPSQIFSLALENKAIKKFIYGYTFYNILILVLLLLIIFIYLKNIHI